MELSNNRVVLVVDEVAYELREFCKTTKVNYTLMKTIILPIFIGLLFS